VATRLPWPKVPKRLPELLSEAEIQALLAAATEPRLRTMITVAYGAGLPATTFNTVKRCGCEALGAA
jgi:site-specific recombinase XerD